MLTRWSIIFQLIFLYLVFPSGYDEVGVGWGGMRLCPVIQYISLPVFPSYDAPFLSADKDGTFRLFVRKIALHFPFL